METERFFKENVAPVMQNGSLYRKHVRFEGDNRFADVQNPKPYDPYFITKNGFGSRMNETNAEVHRAEMSVPKPSDDLELSILCTNSNNYLPKQRPEFDQSALLHKVAPSKIPFGQIQCDDPRILNFPRDTIELASKSHKDFNINVANRFGDFFTMPNSRSKYSTDNDVSHEPMAIKNTIEEHEGCPCCRKYNTPKLRESELQSFDCDHDKKKNKRTLKTKKKCNCNSTKTSDLVINKKPEKKIITSGLEEKSLAIMKNRKLLEGLNESETTLDESGSNDSDSNGEPTIMDLYKIIMLQNEKLTLLQQRMDRLSIPKQPTENQMINATSHHNRIEVLENNIQTCNEELHKISIGVMTSFELVMHSKETQDEILKINQVDECVQTSCYISRTQNQILLDKPGKASNSILSDFGTRQPTNLKTSSKIGEGKQSQSRYAEQTDLSCLATESLYQKLQRTQSPPASPQPSIHVNMDDYSDSEDECSRPNIGWTFYNRVMENVDNMLEKSEPINNLRSKKAPVNKAFNIGETNISKRVTFESRNANMLPRHEVKVSSEASLHMKNLASKYLGTPQLNEFEYTSPLTNINGINKNKYSNDIRNEMSFSTLQYMQRNHLMSTPTFNNILPKKPTKQSLFRQNDTYPQPDRSSPRILDITAIKQQPKLT